MRSLLVVVSVLAFTCEVFGDDKAKAKSKAAAALNIAKARAEAEVKPVAKGADSPHTDLAKAKDAAVKEGKPLVVWVGEPAPAATVKAVDAVHCLLKQFPDAPKARAVVFKCRPGGECDVKSSVESTPSAELLRSMIRESGTHADAGEPETFFISADFDADALPDVPAKAAPPVTRYQTVRVQECFTDAYGRQSCRMVDRLVPVKVENPAALEVLTSGPVKAASDCPCVAATGSCPCAAASSASPVVTYYGTVSRGRPVFFPAVRSAFESFQARPRLFDGRFVNAIAARFRR